MKSLAAVALILVAACHRAAPPQAPPAHTGGVVAALPASGPVILGQGALIVRGQITREERAHTDNQPFVVGPTGGTLALELRRYQGEDTGAPLAILATVALPPGPVTFPITYELRDDQPRAAGTLLVHAQFITDGPARPLQLISEYRTTLRPGVDQLDVVVSGLEPCDSPSAGGFCG